MRRTVAVLAIVLCGCAPKGPAPRVVADLAKAESLLRDGCYSCLQQARLLFDNAANQKGASDAALLIAVREKELGIPVATLPPHPFAPAAALIVGETSGLDPEQRAALSGRGRPTVDADNTARRALDPQFGTDLTATYVALTIDCESPKLIDTVDMAALTKTFDGVPLIQFRLARCGRPALAPSLPALRASDARWNDTLYWEARAELVGGLTRAIDFPKAIGLYAQGREAFPRSLALAMAWSQANMAAEEYGPALSGFDEVLAEYPTHRDALIGRTTALSYLMRHDEAIAAATQVLDLGTWHIGDAHYWRAWNRYHVKDYEPAWQDVESAIRGLSNSRVYMLAGLIAYARKDLPIAEQRFDRAFEIDNSQCDAPWMSGMVSIDRDELKVGAPKFARAMTCFVSAAAALRQDAERLESQVAARGTPATARETRMIERHRRDAEVADEKSAQSAYNAAQCYARTGGKTLALNLVGVAIDHPRMKEKAEALKAAIEKLPN